MLKGELTPSSHPTHPGSPCSAVGQGVLVQLGGETRVDTLVLARRGCLSVALYGAPHCKQKPSIRVCDTDWRPAAFVPPSRPPPPPPAVVSQAHHEWFASGVSRFDAYAARSAPFDPSGWALLGSFSVADGRGRFAFTVPRPAWARVLLLALRAHHDAKSAFCTLSGVEVYGAEPAAALAEEMALADTEAQEANEALTQQQQQQPAAAARAQAQHQPAAAAPASASAAAAPAAAAAAAAVAVPAQGGAGGQHPAGAAGGAAAAGAARPPAPVATSAGETATQQPPEAQPAAAAPAPAAVAAPAEGGIASAAAAAVDALPQPPPVAAPAAASAPPASSAPGGGADANAFRQLVQKIKALEVNGRRASISGALVASCLVA